MFLTATYTLAAGSWAPLLAAQEPLGAQLSMLMKIALMVAIVVVSILGGKSVASAVRLPDHAWKVGIILFTTLLSVAICVLYWPPKLGIDLSGGAILVYEVDQSKKNPENPVDTEKLIASITKRVNPGGQKEITIRPFGPEQIEIIVPEVDQGELERLKGLLGKIGSLEFRILADRNSADLPLIEKASKLAPGVNSLIEGTRKNPITGQDEPRVLARWVPLSDDAQVQGAGFAYRSAPATNTDELPATEILVKIDEYNVTGDDLSNARPGSDEKGQLAVLFRFKSSGATRFSGLTGDNLPTPDGFLRHLAIILDGNLQSAPTIQSVISDSGQISGSFTEAEVNNLVGVLNAGSLPASLNPEPISEENTGPTLGADSIRSGTIATVASVLVVVLFMIYYYRFAGVVAALAVILNVLMTVAVAIAIKAPFTLAGLAGMALTLGMAVDANVLIYERLREGMARGAALRMAIRNGFSRAMSTIIDSNLTTLITATVLYWIGTDRIKGFAVMLWLGLIISMFTSCFCARVAFDIFEKKKWITRLNMRHLFTLTHIDFVSGMKTCMVISLVVIGIGMAALAQRGKGILGIDFTGGSLVSFVFNEPADIGTVRTKLESLESLPDVTVTDVSQGNEGARLRFRMETSNQDLKAVKAELTQAFAGQLSPNTLESVEVALLPATIGPPKDKLSVKPATTTPVTPPVEDKSGDKPAETPTDEAAPADKPAEEKPAEEKPAEETPATPPADEKPADEKPAEPADEKKPDGASRARELDRQVASLAGGADLLLTLAVLGQEDAAAEKEEPAAEGDKPADGEQPADPAVTPEAEKPAVAEDQPADKPAAEEPAATEPPATETTPAAVNTFDGTTSIKLKFKEPVTHDTMQDMVALAFESPQFKELDVKPPSFEVTNASYRKGSSASYHEWEIRLALPEAQGKILATSIEKQVGATPYYPSSSNIGSKVADSAWKNAIFALGVSFLFITLYLWVRFQKVIYGVAAVVALIHDVLVAVSALAVSYYVAPYLGILLVDPFKIDLNVVAALLTIVGFSVNDTVVTFDRIREVKGKSLDLTPQIINDSVNQTLSRTVLTSLTVLMVTVVLYIWGGKSIHGFAFTFMVGVLVGTYSSIYIAAPMLLWLSGKSTSDHRGQGASTPSGGALSKSA